MKKCIFCAILLLTLPAFATIANVQSNASWTCTGTGTSIMCPVTLTTYPTVNHHMLAVWTFWESTSTYTASVSDSQNNGIYNGTIYVYPSAVGPTLQSASNASAQILYAADITGSGVGHYDTVTVTFTCVSSCGSPSISAGGIVAVEYSGADTFYPLDSASAGYNYSGNPTTTMDSGTVAPANANILLFGGGTNDTGTATPGSGFSNVLTSGAPNNSIVEQNTTPITSNNTLQRATGGLSASGNWVMQMAVFRAASWGLVGGSPVSAGQSLVSNPGVFTETQPNDYLLSTINGCNPGAIFSNPVITSVYYTAASDGCVAVPTSSSVNDATGVMGILSNASTFTQASGGQFIGLGTVAGAQIWGINSVSTNSTPAAVGAQIHGYEMDVGPGVALSSGTLTQVTVSGTTTTYTGTITGGAGDAFAGLPLTVLGFANPNNNIANVSINSSTGTSLTVTTANQANETGASATAYIQPATPNTIDGLSILGGSNGATLPSGANALFARAIYVQPGGKKVSEEWSWNYGLLFGHGATTIAAIFLDCNSFVLQNCPSQAQQFQSYSSVSPYPNYITTLQNDPSGNFTITPGSFGTRNVSVAGSLSTTLGMLATGTQTVSGCSLTTAVGGAWAGAFKSGTSGTCTVTITPGITATNGFACTATDLTTAADIIKQTGTLSTTTATISGTTASSDLITWSCVAF